MVIKYFTLKAAQPDQIFTEIMYEIASARSDRAELVRIDFQAGRGKKFIDTTIRVLKKMKTEGRIQFFATKDSFSSLNTEAVFLQNKYPEYFASPVSSEGELIYIKL